MNNKIESHICYYCARPAVFRLDNGFWCCKNSWHKCPAIAGAISKRQCARYYYWPKQTMERAVERGEIKCYICGGIATHARLVAKDDKRVWGGCCSEFARGCPKYSEYRSNLLLKRYADHPEYKERMREVMFEVQNRPEIKQKKSDSMTILHNEDCDKCVVFQENYNQSIKKRLKTVIKTKSDPEWRKEFSKLRTGIKYKTKED